MTDTTKALRIELEDLKNIVYELTESKKVSNKQIHRERVRAHN